MTIPLSLALALLGLAFGLHQWLRSRRQLRRLDRMLTQAISGGFVEREFDESAVSALESRMARFLNGSAVSTRSLAAEKEAIKALISDISHQTKTPIANILLYASLLAESDLTPQQRQQVEALADQGEKLAFLTDSLVKASRLETGILAMTPEPHAIQQLLDGAAAQAAASAGRRGIRLTVEPSRDEARFDLKWTTEALYNVVDNAVKYTPAGGSVTLSAAGFDLFCRVDVADTGPGIPEQEQASVFHRFYRGTQVRDQEGLGIGLYLTREILNGQGGYIKVSSSPGHGSCFSLYLPRA